MALARQGWGQKLKLTRKVLVNKEDVHSGGQIQGLDLSGASTLPPALQIKNIQTLNLNSSGAPAVARTTVDTLTLATLAAKTVTIPGSATLTLTNAGNNALTFITPVR